jgi:uncharacterized protein YjgD (DUF1641 family)
MTATTVGPLTTDERLDLLSQQVQMIADELQAQRLQRQRWAELVEDSAPVMSGAMEMVTRELQELSDDLTLEDAARLARSLARATPTMEAMLSQLEAVRSLGEEIVPLTSAAMASTTSALQELDAKGYFTFARGGAAIMDRVVTSFTEEDLDALGDNVVLILNTVKEMTQPEVMNLLQRTALTAQEVDEEVTEPPSLLALLKQMRDPQTRRGLARVMTMLRTVGADESTPTPHPREER